MFSSRAVRAVAALTVLPLALLACGSDGDDDASATGDAAPAETETAADAVVLSQAEAESALLAAADVGPEFVETELDESEDEAGGDLGCLTELDQLETTADSATEAEVQFDDEFGGQVSNFVASFDSADAVEQSLQAILDSLDGCTSVEAEEDGVQFSLEVSVDQESVGSPVDQQVNIIASGTGVSEGLELPIAIGFSLARLDNNLTGVSVVEFGGSERLFAYTETAVAKLDAVMKGEPIPTQDVDGASEGEPTSTIASVGEPVIVG